MTSARLKYPSLDASFCRLALLGEGSFGKVYLAERIPSPSNSENSNSLNTNNAKGEKEGVREMVAVKKLKVYPRKKYTSATIEKVEEYPEVAIMGALNHPNLLALRGMVQR
jgi:serine/threonine protein kinase